MVKQIRKLLPAVLLLGCANSAHAAGIDWGGIFVDQVNTLITAKGGILVHDGLLLLTFIGIFKLLMLLIPAMLRRLDMFHHYHFNFAEILILLFQIALCSVALHHYMVPFPASSVSVHQIPTALAHDLVAEFDTKTMDDFLTYVQTVTTKLEKPSPLAMLDVGIYFMIISSMGLIYAAMYIITSFGFVGTGLFTVLGPLFIPLALTKHFYSWFWNWLQGLVAFAAYRVMATVVGWVWSNVYIYFFVHGVGADYTLANWIVLFPVVIMLTCSFLFCMISIPIITSLLFSGAGAIGQSYVNSATGAIRAALA